VPANMSKVYKSIVGIDDATRCPVIGSIMIAGVRIKSNDVKKLKKIGVKDSKKLTYAKILSLEHKIIDIAEAFVVMPITATRISRMSKDFNLNDLECDMYCKIARMIGKNAKIYINNFDVSREKFIERANKLGYKFNFDNWVIDHNNESRDVVVGAASILAKAMSIHEYEELKKLFGDFGSGNPNDKKTIQFIKKNPNCEIIRKSWATYKRLVGNEKGV